MKITKETFEHLNHKKFDITFGEDKVLSSQLIEVKANKNIPLQEGQSEPFSLVFEVDSQEVFDQDTYMIKNDEFEQTPMFLVPIGSDEKGVRYEAIFN